MLIVSRTSESAGCSSSLVITPLSSVVLVSSVCTVSDAASDTVFTGLLDVHPVNTKAVSRAAADY